MSASELAAAPPSTLPRVESYPTARRGFLHSVALSFSAAAVASVGPRVEAARADEGLSLERCIYLIVRVQEATEQVDLSVK